MVEKHKNTSAIYGFLQAKSIRTASIPRQSKLTVQLHQFQNNPNSHVSLKYTALVSYKLYCGAKIINKALSHQRENTSEKSGTEVSEVPVKSFLLVTIGYY